MQGKKIKTTTIILLILILMVSSGCSGRPDPSLQTATYKGYFTVGYDPDGYLTYQGEGLLIDIIKEAGRRMDLQAPTYPVNAYSWQALLHNKEIDVMIDAVNEDDLKSIYVYRINTVLVKPDGYEISDDSVIGVLDAGANSRAAEEHKKYSNACFSYYVSSLELMNDLRSGNIGAAILGELDFKAQSQDSDNFLTEMVNSREVCFTMRAGEQSFLDALNAAIFEMQSDGTIDGFVAFHTVGEDQA